MKHLLRNGAAPATGAAAWELRAKRPSPLCLKQRGKLLGLVRPVPGGTCRGSRRRSLNGTRRLARTVAHTADCGTRGLDREQPGAHASVNRRGGRTVVRIKAEPNGGGQKLREGGDVPLPPREQRREGRKERKHSFPAHQTSLIANIGDARNTWSRILYHAPQRNKQKSSCTRSF